MTNHPKKAMLRVKLPDGWARKISTIDAQLTPELLDHILRTTARV